MENLHCVSQPSDFSTLYAADILTRLFDECPKVESLKLYANGLRSPLDETVYCSQPSLTGEKVLLLSKNDFEIRSLKKMFSFYDVDMRFARNTKHLVDLVKINFSLVIVSDDFDMAYLIMVSKLRQTLKNTRFVRLTMQKEAAYQSLGFDACLVHPIDTEELKQLLNQVKRKL